MPSGDAGRPAGGYSPFHGLLDLAIFTTSAGLHRDNRDIGEWNTARVANLQESLQQATYGEG